jgi:hypothetical protein
VFESSTDEETFGNQKAYEENGIGWLNSDVRQMNEMTSSISQLKKTVSNEDIDVFWKSISSKAKPTQLERYERRDSPECIKKFISLGGGPKMGTTLEQYARFRFKSLCKRKSGKSETGYDHLVTIHDSEVYIEQKSSGHWGEDDYRWQHVEQNHKWNILLLCGIDYTCIKFWVMDRKTFNKLIDEKKITNQGNKAKDSSEGMWFNYSDVKDYLTEVHTDEDIIRTLESPEASD